MFCSGETWPVAADYKLYLRMKALNYFGWLNILHEHLRLTVEILRKIESQFKLLQFPPLKAEGFTGNDTVRFGAPGTKQLVVPGTIFGQMTMFSAVFGGVSTCGTLDEALNSHLKTVVTTRPIEFVADRSHVLFFRLAWP